MNLTKQDVKPIMDEVFAMTNSAINKSARLAKTMQEIKKRLVSGPLTPEERAELRKRLLYLGCMQ